MDTGDKNACLAQKVRNGARRQTAGFRFAMFRTPYAAHGPDEAQTMMRSMAPSQQDPKREAHTQPLRRASRKLRVEVRADAQLHIERVVCSSEARREAAPTAAPPRSVEGLVLPHSAPLVVPVVHWKFC